MIAAAVVSRATRSLLSSCVAFGFTVSIIVGVLIIPVLAICILYSRLDRELLERLSSVSLSTRHWHLSKRPRSFSSNATAVIVIIVLIIVHLVIIIHLLTTNTSVAVAVALGGASDGGR